MSRHHRPVMSFMPPDDRQRLEIISHFMADKLTSGTFSDVDGNTLAYELNVARRLALVHCHADALETADDAMAAFLAVRKRREITGKWGAAGPEFITLRDTVPTVVQYLIRQPMHRIDLARDYVIATNRKMREQGILYCEPTDDGRLENVVTLEEVR